MGRKPERTEPLERATFTLRKDQIEFLKTQGNASQIMREAIDKIMEEKIAKVMTREAKILQLNTQLKEIDLRISKLRNEQYKFKPGEVLYGENYSDWDAFLKAEKITLEEAASRHHADIGSLSYYRNVFDAYKKQIADLLKEREEILKQIAALGPG